MNEGGVWSELVAPGQAPVPSAPIPTPAPAPSPPKWKGPKEGSAAWQAEQVAMGKVPIPFTPKPFDPTAGRSETPGWGEALGAAWRSIRLLRYLALVALLAWGGFKWFGGGGPSAGEIEDAFVPIRGYEYAATSDPALDAVEKRIRSYPFLRDVLTGVEMKEVVKDGERVAIVLIFGVDPDEVEGDPLEGTFPIGNGISAFSVESSDKSFNGYTFSMPQGTLKMFYDDDGFIVDVVGLDNQHVENITKGIGLGNL